MVGPTRFTVEGAVDLRFSDDVAVVVGSANGLGLAIAAGFAEEGVDLALIDRDPTVTTRADELRKAHGIKAIAIVADVTDKGAMSAAAAEVARELGRQDHLVYAVGIGSGKFGFPFWNLEPEDWGGVIEVNLLGAVTAAHAFVPALIAAESATMLFLSSVAGQIGSQTDPPYSAAKAGLINFAQCAAKDLARRGVRVNCVCPGMIRTQLNRSVWQAWNDRQPDEKRQSYDEWSAAKIDQVVPLGRWQEPEDIAAMAVFLASPRAKNITGQTINVDGGFVMHW